MRFLISLLWTALRKEAASRAVRAARRNAPELVWFLPPFSWLSLLRHPKRAFQAYLCFRSAALTWRLLRRVLKR